MGSNLTGSDLRRPSLAAEDTYDLIVIGGGVYGAALLLESSLHGLRGLLVERDDFGGATSWNSLRTIHGGLRYLQSGDLHRFRESVEERSWFLRTFPDLVEPLKCLMPLYGNGLRRPGIFRIAFAINDFLSRRRNDELREDRTLPASKVIATANTIELFPSVRRHGLRGGAAWHDAVMLQPQRIVVEMLRHASSLGSSCVNYAAAKRLLISKDKKVEGVVVEDRSTGADAEFRAPIVVNCAGPWSRQLAAQFDTPEHDKLFIPTLAFNLLLDRPPLSEAALAVAPPHPGARTYFLHSWRGRNLFAGTFHAPWNGSVDTSKPPAELLEEFLGDLNAAVPGLELTEEDIVRVFSGLLPGQTPGNDALAVRELIHEHSNDSGLHGLVSVSGVKFTTARRVAQKTLETVRPDVVGCRRPLPDREIRVAPTTEGFLALAQREPEVARELLVRIVEEEAVVQLDDLLLRRTDWGIDARQYNDVAATVSGLLSERFPTTA